MLYTSLNSADLDFVHGHPLVRFTGVFRPGYPVLGSDCVGRIESLGRDMEGFEAGELVWADLSNPLSYGTFAEYVSVPVASLQRMPLGIRPEEAACLPTAEVVASQNVNIKRKPGKGEAVKRLNYMIEKENWNRLTWQEGVCLSAQDFSPYLTGTETALQNEIVPILTGATSISGTPLNDLGTSAAGCPG